MVKSGVPSQYAATLYASSMYGQPAYGVGGPTPGIPMLPMPGGVGGPLSNGYGRDFDGASSGKLVLSLPYEQQFNNIVFTLINVIG